MILTPKDMPPGHYVGVGGTIYRVTANKAGTRVFAQRMLVTADADGCKVIEWAYAPGLGRDILLSPLSIRDVSRAVRLAVAA